MADYYLTFSEVLPNLTKKEEAWLKHRLETIYVFGKDEYEETVLPPHLDPQNADWYGCRNSRDLPCQDSYNTEAGFEFDFQGDRKDRKGWGRNLWVHADSTAEIERLGHLVQKFLRQFRPHKCWWLTYATSCSKPHAGEFGGGGLFVTARTMKWTNADEFIRRELRAFERRQKKGRKPARD